MSSSMPPDAHRRPLPASGGMAPTAGSATGAPSLHVPSDRAAGSVPKAKAFASGDPVSAYVRRASSRRHVPHVSRASTPIHVSGVMWSARSAGFPCASLTNMTIDFCAAGTVVADLTNDAAVEGSQTRSSQNATARSSAFGEIEAHAPRSRSYQGARHSIHVASWPYPRAAARAAIAGTAPPPKEWPTNPIRAVSGLMPPPAEKAAIPASSPAQSTS